jgi:rhodanese-related sulfurtransferase
MNRNWLVQTIIILIFSTIVALAINSARGGGIAVIGNWPSRTSSGEGPVIPPSAESGDPPFVTLEDAVAKYQSPDIVFIDSRDPEDYQYGHIKGAISIPFDYLDDSWDAFIDSLDWDNGYVVYCSGDECESSLNMGRYLYHRGFPHIFIFYGGWREWEDNSLPITWGDTSTEGGTQ